MRLGVRAKLFVVSFLLVLAVVVAAGGFLEGELRERLQARLLDELYREAETTGALIDLVGESASLPTMDALAERLGDATGSRYTIIATDGTVLGDSSIAPVAVPQMDDHSMRPEVLEALRAGRGRQRRYSTTVDDYMLYAALTHGDLIIRVARPLSEVDSAVARQRWQFVIAGLLGLALAVLMSLLASYWMARALRRLADSAREIARGRARHRAPVDTADELGHLAGSLNQLAEEIEHTVSQLARERAQFETVLESMTDAVIALDRQRQVTLMNAAALRLLGLDEPPLGVPLAEFVRAPALQELVAGERDDEDEAEFALPGSHRLVLARLAPATGAEGGRVLVLHDVSELRRLETVRRDFVANVSHELRTPVSVIQANAETLLDGASDRAPMELKLLSALHRNAERLSSIIGDLLDLSRLEAGRYDLDREVVDVRMAVERAVESIEPRARERNTRIEIQVAEAVRARADAKALDQILVNLIDNAVKYTPEGSSVRVGARATDRLVRIEVEDNGAGIAPAHHERVFERFYRVDPGRSRDMGGTGLGLSIVRHLAEAMRGRVGVRSARPRGSIFWVNLPRA